LARKERGPSPFPLRKTRRDFQALAGIRAKEAGVLAKNGDEEGAYYLGGLAIECALKACIAKKMRRHDFPLAAKDASRVYTHDLDDLLKLAELEGHLDKAMKGNRALTANWGVVKNWRVESRYETSGLKGTDMVAAVNSADGVLPWIQQRW
jgi:HEPN domain-containing protein